MPCRARLRTALSRAARPLESAQPSRFLRTGSVLPETRPLRGPLVRARPTDGLRRLQAGTMLGVHLPGGGVGRLVLRAFRCARKPGAIKSGT